MKKIKCNEKGVCFMNMKSSTAGSVPSDLIPLKKATKKIKRQKKKKVHKEPQKGSKSSSNAASKAKTSKGNPPIKRKKKKLNK